MNLLPSEILGVLGQFLTLKEILSLATTNADFQKNFLREDVNEQLANHFGFPYGLSLIQLKKYELMSLNDRLLAAIQFDDMRVINKVIELGANNIKDALYLAAKSGKIKIVNELIQFIKPSDLTEAVRKAVNENREDILDIIHNAAILKKKDKKFSRSLTSAMITAAEDGNLKMVNKLYDLGGGIPSWSIIKAAERGHSEVVGRLVELAHPDTLQYALEDIDSMLEEESAEQAMQTLSRYI